MNAGSSVRKKGPLAWYFNTNLLLRIFIGLVGGAVVGLLVGPNIAVIEPLGAILVRLLKMIVMPVILFSLIVGSASISPNRIGRIGVKIVLFYLITSALAVVIGLIIGNIFRPGSNLDLAGIAGMGRELAKPKLMDTLLNIIPTNPFKAMVDGNVLPVIFFSIFFGLGLSFLEQNENEKIQKSGQRLFSCFEASAEVMYLIVRWVLEFAPIGVFALIAVVFGKQGATAFGALGKVTLAVYAALLIHLVLIYGGLLSLFRLKFFRFFAGAREAIITAYVTRSSSGTLPVTLRCAEENLGISRNISSFTLPLGATINMDGTAIYQGVCVLFVASAVGIPLNMVQQLTIILTAVLASIGTAGVPGAGSIMLLMVLDSINLPVTEGSPVAMAYAMILGIDALLDMGRTALNVTGDLTCSAIVAKTENELDLAKWQ